MLKNMGWIIIFRLVITCSNLLSLCFCEQLFPSCEETSLYSCIGTDFNGNMIYLWSVEKETGSVLFENAIYSSYEALFGERDKSQRKSVQPIRIGIRIASPKSDDQQDIFSQPIVVPLDMSPSLIAHQLGELFIETNTDYSSSVSLNIESLIRMIQDYQVHHFFVICHQLHLHLEKHNVSMKEIEGGSLTFLNKVKLMQKLAQEQDVNTVCEIGFNAGYSSLLWLTSGVKKVLAFELGQYSYSSIAANWLSSRFPGRLQVILGDSRHTILDYQWFNPQFDKCDLVFVDGGHTYENVHYDLKAMKNMVSIRQNNGSDGSGGGGGHILLVDDINQSPVAQAWKEFVNQGVVEESHRITSKYSDHFVSSITEEMVWNGLDYAEEEAFVVKEWESTMVVGRYK